MLVIATILIYFVVLYAIAKCASRGGNEAFFLGNRQSPWQVVAFGMIGASISGVTFIGVPGWVMSIDMTYMQMCFGFIVGYAVVAFWLLPRYADAARSGVTIYSYLLARFGKVSHRTGASFFIVSKLLGSAAKFYVVCEILQLCIGRNYDVPYVATMVVMLLMIWLYTRQSGIKALVWTDAVQTLCLLAAVVLLFVKVSGMLDLSVSEAMAAVWRDEHSRMVEWRDWTSSQHVVKQFLSGVFVVIVMTGLDQDMMQKNLSCRSLRDAQKDLCAYGVMFVPVNFMLMALGVLLLMLYAKMGLPVPAKGDELLANVVLDGTLGTVCVVLFTIGVVASAFSSADSALTALTTSFTVDILRKEHDERVRKVVHWCMMVAFVVVTLAFHALGSGSVMDLIYTLVSYTYGPLLGLFAFGMLTGHKVNERLVPWIAVVPPVVCYVVETLTESLTSYRFGYEILLMNGLLTFAALWWTKTKR